DGRATADGAAIAAGRGDRRGRGVAQHRRSATAAGRQSTAAPGGVKGWRWRGRGEKRLLVVSRSRGASRARNVNTESERPPSLLNQTYYFSPSFLALLPSRDTITSISFPSAVLISTS